VPSVDGYWIKTSSKENHQLIVIRNQNITHFMLILATDSPPPDFPIPIKIGIDNIPTESSYLKFLERRPEQSIFTIELSEESGNIQVSRMISGLTMSIIFTDQVKGNRRISFSLLGFTAALNDLLIADDIGSLDPGWMLKNHKDRELFCYLASNVSIEAMHYRILGYTYSRTLHSIKNTGYPIIDNNLADIISQTYNIPRKQLPTEPKAEKYMIFRRCIKQHE